MRDWLKRLVLRLFFPHGAMWRVTMEDGTIVIRDGLSVIECLFTGVDRAYLADCLNNGPCLKIEPEEAP